MRFAGRRAKTEEDAKELIRQIVQEGSCESSVFRRMVKKNQELLSQNDLPGGLLPKAACMPGGEGSSEMFMFYWA